MNALNKLPVLINLCADCFAIPCAFKELAKNGAAYETTQSEDGQRITDQSEYKEKRGESFSY